MVDIFSSLEGKKVLITGNTGFKGSWLTLCLTRLNCELTGLSIDDHTSAGIFKSLRLSNKIQQKYANINDRDEVSSIVNECNPDLVFHLAAQPIVSKSYKDPILTFKDNILGTAYLLDACINMDKCPVIVNVTSDKCYENLEMGKSFKESDSLGGNDPYSASKACAEIVAKSFRKSYSTLGAEKIVSVRAGNVIGGGDFAEDRLYPDIIRAIQSNSKLIIRKPNAVRPWQHVLDPLWGYMRVAALMLSGNVINEAYNFGPSEESEKSVRDLVEAAREYLTITEVDYDKTDWEEANYLTLDSNLAKQKLGWEPLFNFNKTVELTSQWYLMQMENRDNLFDVTMSQIDMLFNSIRSNNNY